VSCLSSGNQNDIQSCDKNITDSDTICEIVGDSIVNYSKESDTKVAKEYFTQLSKYFSTKEGANMCKNFGMFEKENILFCKNSNNPTICGYKKLGDLHLLLLNDGEDCERLSHYLIIDNHFNVLDSLSFMVGGCEPDLPENEIFSSGSIFKKDTVGEYCYFCETHEPVLNLIDDNIFEFISTTYIVKNITTGKYRYVDFDDTIIYKIDTVGRFRTISETMDTFNVEKLFTRMEMESK
jgi:hypothetical protein